MNYAILDAQSVVQNIIVASNSFCQTAYPNRWVKLAPNQWCDIGAAYNPATKVFTPAP